MERLEGGSIEWARLEWLDEARLGDPSVEGRVCMLELLVEAGDTRPWPAWS
jgi:hypothetical protein